ncbi:MAG: alkaline phosphatase family protein [Armatimonadota bacterium]|nr:MAG: alkaline phosphatase family protein [Armatimonadota bacterium]
MLRGHTRAVVSLAALGLVTAAVSHSALTRRDTPRNIILIGWDGVQRDHLKQMIARREVPNLMALVVNGKLVAIDIARTTDTKAGWTQILTGYEPEVTGVFNNRRFRPIPLGYTVFERLEESFGPENIYTAAIIGKLHNLGGAGPSKVPADEPEPEAGQEDRRWMRPRPGTPIPAEPFYLVKKNLDLYQEGLGDADSVGARALQVLDKHGRERFFLFVHFEEPDKQGHIYGENSPEYTDGVKQADKWLGKILAKLRGLGIRDETMVYVTSDHGFDEGFRFHFDAPYTFLAADDRAVMRRGLREDIAPTILWRFGVEPSSIDPPLAGHPLQQPYTPPTW